MEKRHDDPRESWGLILAGHRDNFFIPLGRRFLDEAYLKAQLIVASKIENPDQLSGELCILTGSIANGVQEVIQQTSKPTGKGSNRYWGCRDGKSCAFLLGSHQNPMQAFRKAEELLNSPRADKEPIVIFRVQVILERTLQGVVVKRPGD